MIFETLKILGIFGIGLVLLVKGADLFSNFAEKLALFFKIPPFIIGMTIVAFGTSLPELFSASTAIISGVPELALGDILGSSITNIFLVLGLSTLIMREGLIKISYDLIHVDLPYFVGSAFIAIMVLMDGKVSTIESIILISGLIIYILYSINIRKDIAGEKILETLREEHPKNPLSVITFILGILGLLGLIVGSKLFVNSIIGFTAQFNLSLELVAITLVPLSSNLPELGITIRNALKGNSELVVGNILGSNIFNIFGVLGISSLFGTVTASTDFFLLTLPVLALATILYFFITQEKEITRWEGGLLILSYLIYLNLTYSFYI